MIDFPLLGPTLAFLYGFALYCVFRVLLTYRTSQGALAWIIGLLAFPFITLPLFVLFGRNRFSGYVRARRLGEQSLNYHLTDFEQQTSSLTGADNQHLDDDLKVLCRLTKQPFTTGNECHLLKDGRVIFKALFDAMENAREYILMEFYIVRSDRVGQRVKTILKRKLAQGVKVYFLYDDIGSVLLSKGYLRELSRAGAQVASFGDGNVRRRRFQMNFRNHRKLLICDGEVGFVGGINLGDEYLGTEFDQGRWRDTHCCLRGPAVLGLQLAWLEDWNWANANMPALNWQPAATSRGNQEVLILPTGPADPFETCTLFFLNCINNARQRIWITSPYFVPDFQVVNALQLAALRGVDVRIIIPEKSDGPLVRLAAYSYLVQASRAGIGIYRYQPAFMHQKIILVDDRYAVVSTANLDNRSMRLNFEIMALSTGAEFVRDVEAMLEDDLSACVRMTALDYQDRSLVFRITCRAVRLAAPLL
ncbi:MAG: cardiolipin synthase [Oleiphilaceae bacterium]|nr:cardiolipin synthase [Oleiphilaceae bacterium]